MAGDHQRQDPAADDGTVTTTAKLLVYDDGKNAFVPEWGSFEIKRGESVEIAIINGLKIGNKRNVSGTVNVTELKGDVMYEVVFVVMWKNNATTWDVPMNLKVVLPDGSQMEPATQTRTDNLISKPKQQWMEILAGEFKTVPNMNQGSIYFSLDVESEQVHERGLVIIKSVILRRVSTPLKPNPIKPPEINVRELSIYRGQLKDHWTWDVIQDGPNNRDTFFEVVELVDIVWLEVIGKYDASDLRAGVTYEVVLFIRLKKDAQGWENNQVSLRVNDQSRSQPIDTYKSDDFEELIVGDITVDRRAMTDGIEFSLSETTSGRSKNGLFIWKVLLRTKNNGST